MQDFANVADSEECQEKCNGLEYCNYWTFHTTGYYKGFCRVMAEVDYFVENLEVTNP